MFVKFAKLVIKNLNFILRLHLHYARRLHWTSISLFEKRIIITHTKLLQFYYQIILIGGNTKNTIIEAIRTKPPNPRRTAPEVISAPTNKLIKQITDLDCSYCLPWFAALFWLPKATASNTIPVIVTAIDDPSDERANSTACLEGGENVPMSLRLN